MAETILVMWSGGISSTAALYQLLVDPNYKDYDILVHHCHLIDVQNRATAESLACKSILDYLSDKKKYRQFFFSESTHDYRFLAPPRYGRNLHEIDIASFMASQMIAGNADIKFVVMGGTQSDIKSTTAYEKLQSRGAKILEAALELDEKAVGIALDYPFITNSISKVYASMPRTIANKTWSCKLPTYDEDSNEPIVCGQCIKCINPDYQGIRKR